MDDCSSVRYRPYSYNPSAKALTLHNSAGKIQSRLHLLEYDGMRDKDRYAVAAKKIDLKPGEAPSLGWFARKFYILYSHTDDAGVTTLYKINRESLRKRLLISSKDMENLADEEGIAKNLDTLITKKTEEIKKWRTLCVGQDKFSENFIAGLVKAGVSPDLYREINLFSKVLIHRDNYPPRSVLVLRHQPAAQNLCVGAAPFNVVGIDQDTYKKIKSGHRIPKNILDLIDDQPSCVKQLKEAILKVILEQTVCVKAVLFLSGHPIETSFKSLINKDDLSQEVDSAIDALKKFDVSKIKLILELPLACENQWYEIFSFEKKDSELIANQKNCRGVEELKVLVDAAIDRHFKNREDLRLV